MHRWQRGWVVPAVLLLFFFGASGLADSSPKELECIPYQPYELSADGEEPSPAGAKGVKRNRVLLEVFGRPT